MQVLHTTDVASSFEPVCHSGKIILQEQEMWIIMWIIMHVHFYKGWYIFFVVKIKSEISKWKLQTLEVFLKTSNILEVLQENYPANEDPMY